MRGALVMEDGAYVAIEDLEVAGWEPIGPQHANPGPFYLVWSKPEQANLDAHPRQAAGREAPQLPMFLHVGKAAFHTLLAQAVQRPRRGRLHPLLQPLDLWFVLTAADRPPRLRRDVQQGGAVVEACQHRELRAGTHAERLVHHSRPAVAGGDGKLRWWNIESGQCVRVREAHAGTIQSLKRSPDGRSLASCGDDGAINVWELESGEHLRTLRRDRPYERMDISGVRGLTDAQRATLLTLGAIEKKGGLLKE